MKKRSTAYLRARRIEDALRARGSQLRVHSVDVGVRWAIYHGLKPLGESFGKLARMADDLALALGVRVVQVVRNGSFVDIRVPLDDDEVDTVRLPEHDEVVNPGAAYLGVDEFGNPLYVDVLSDQVVHVLVAGAPGAGKTVLMRAMIMSLARKARVDQVGLVLMDPAGAGYAPFRGLPHLVRPVMDDVGEMVSTLEWLVGLMERGGTQVPLVIFIDELADMCMASSEAVTHLTRLVQRGRQAGLHVVAGTQRPTAKVIGGLVKGNFPVRIVGSVASPEDAKIATGRARTGAEDLLGAGDFLLVERSGGVVRFQAPYVSEREIEEAVCHLRGGRDVRARRMRVLPTVNARVLEYRKQHGRWPSQRWVCRELGVGRARAREILENARENA